LVAPAALDSRSGYVNAVGWIRADTGPLSVVSFSPLGEAIFSEIDDPSDAIWSSAQGSAMHSEESAGPITE
jgi:hypothetical protein